jgi:uncharacterized protein YuzE
MTTPAQPNAVEEHRIGRWLKLTVDREVDAAYIALIDDDIVETRALDHTVNIDLNSEGYVVGIEILRVDHP